MYWVAGSPTTCSRTTDFTPSTPIRAPPAGVAVLVMDGDTRGVLLDAGRGQELDAARLLRAFEQRQMDVDAMDHRIGVAETLAEGVARFDAADERRVDRVVHLHESLPRSHGRPCSRATSCTSRRVMSKPAA